jgi:hypothetical protein
MKYFFGLLIAIAIMYNVSSQAQNSEEPLFEDFKNAFSKPYLRIGLVLQTTGNFQIERQAGTNGFELTNLRFKLSGRFDKGIGYAIQTSFTRSPSILDARIYYEIDKSFIVDAGLYKAPFSREFLISTPYTDFVSRAQLVALVPNRQIGVTARGLIPGTQLTYSAGIFNGNRFFHQQEMIIMILCTLEDYLSILKYPKTKVISWRLQLILHKAMTKM